MLYLEIQTTTKLYSQLKSLLFDLKLKVDEFLYLVKNPLLFSLFRLQVINLKNKIFTRVLFPAEHGNNIN